MASIYSQSLKPVNDQILLKANSADVAASVIALESADSALTTLANSKAALSGLVYGSYVADITAALGSVPTNGLFCKMQTFVGDYRAVWRVVS